MIYGSVASNGMLLLQTKEAEFLTVKDMAKYYPKGYTFKQFITELKQVANEDKEFDEWLESEMAEYKSFTGYN